MGEICPNGARKDCKDAKTCFLCHSGEKPGQDVSYYAAKFKRSTRSQLAPETPNAAIQNTAPSPISNVKQALKFSHELKKQKKKQELQKNENSPDSCRQCEMIISQSKIEIQVLEEESNGYKVRLAHLETTLREVKEINKIQKEEAIKLSDKICLLQDEIRRLEDLEEMKAVKEEVAAQEVRINLLESEKSSSSVKIKTLVDRVAVTENKLIDKEKLLTQIEKTHEEKKKELLTKLNTVIKDNLALQEKVELLNEINKMHELTRDSNTSESDKPEEQSNLTIEPEQSLISALKEIVDMGPKPPSQESTLNQEEIEETAPSNNGINASTLNHNDNKELVENTPSKNGGKEFTKRTKDCWFGNRCRNKKNCRFNHDILEPTDRHVEPAMTVPEGKEDLVPKQSWEPTPRPTPGPRKLTRNNESKEGDKLLKNCRFGKSCRKQNCRFNHDMLEDPRVPKEDSREDPRESTPTRKVPRKFTRNNERKENDKILENCRFGKSCRKPNCRFDHDMPEDIDRQLPKPKQWCRYGLKCKRRDCHFLHPTEGFSTTHTTATLEPNKFYPANNHASSKKERAARSPPDKHDGKEDVSPNNSVNYSFLANIVAQATLSIMEKLSLRERPLY